MIYISYLSILYCTIDLLELTCLMLIVNIRAGMLWVSHSALHFIITSK